MRSVLAVLVPSLSFSTLCFPLCISVTGAHLLEGVGRRAGSWLGCQVVPAIGQSPSWSSLSMMEAPGCLRQPTSTERLSCLDLSNMLIHESHVFELWIEIT